MSLACICCPPTSFPKFKAYYMLAAFDQFYVFGLVSCFWAQQLELHKFYWDVSLPTTLGTGLLIERMDTIFGLFETFTLRAFVSKVKWILYMGSPLDTLQLLHRGFHTPRV